MSLETDQRTSVVLGSVGSTPGVLATFSKAEMFGALARHESGDWGDVCKEDEGANDRALKDGTRLLSVYKFDRGRVLWIITEWDRSATTLLLPSEY